MTSNQHLDQLKVTENVFELLVQEKRRRRELEVQLETLGKKCNELTGRNQFLSTEQIRADVLQEQYQALREVAELVNFHGPKTGPQWAKLTEVLYPASAPPENPSYVGPPDSPDSNPAMSPESGA